MHGNPVKRNGGQESVTRQFAIPQAVVVGNPEKISGGTWQVSATALPPFVFQKGNLRASYETWREDFFCVSGRERRESGKTGLKGTKRQ